jgi:hypothetical protein
LLKTDVKRKNGLIINEGGVLSKDERERQREENEKDYGVDQVGAFREHSGNIQGTFILLQVIQGVFREHSLSL